MSSAAIHGSRSFGRFHDLRETFCGSVCCARRRLAPAKHMRAVASFPSIQSTRMQPLADIHQREYSANYSLRVRPMAASTSMPVLPVRPTESREGVWGLGEVQVPSGMDFGGRALYKHLPPGKRLQPLRRSGDGIKQRLQHSIALQEQRHRIAPKPPQLRVRKVAAQRLPPEVRRDPYKAILERRRMQDGLQAAKSRMVNNSSIGDLIMGRMRTMIANFQDWDLDNSGVIEHDEFCSAMAQLGVKSRNHVQLLWRRCDMDGSGAIDKAELMKALERHAADEEEERGDHGGDTPPEQEATTELKMAGRSFAMPADGKKAISRQKMKSAKAQLHEALEEISVDSVVDLCRQWDVDNSGTVNRREFAEAMNSLGLKISVGEINALFNKVDGDGSGKISYHELKQYLTKHRADEHNERMRNWRAEQQDAEIGTRKSRSVAMS